ncbi:hypothetical protein GJ744_008322 [Endocarpon pusillum]|uniref:Uncharacterized protein n=1 Tax=Endocarpon pusillum TaxID=364733 RepID=A0A8H7E5B5_9EURO|nr:hypothetical protein GJ744_008322 [Endocarpon pusillum]
MVVTNVVERSRKSVTFFPANHGAPGDPGAGRGTLQHACAAIVGAAGTAVIVVGPMTGSESVDAPGVGCF